MVSYKKRKCLAGLIVSFQSCKFIHEKLNKSLCVSWGLGFWCLVKCCLSVCSQTELIRHSSELWLIIMKLQLIIQIKRISWIIWLYIFLHGLCPSPVWTENICLLVIGLLSLVKTFSLLHLTWISFSVDKPHCLLHVSGINPSCSISTSSSVPTQPYWSTCSVPRHRYTHTHSFLHWLMPSHLCRL